MNLGKGLACILRIFVLVHRLNFDDDHSSLYYLKCLPDLSFEILSKGRKPDNFEPHNSQITKRSFTNIRGFRSNFVGCESFLQSNYPDILTLCKTNLDDAIHSGNFSVRGYITLIRKDSVTHVHGLAVYVKTGLTYTGLLSRKHCGFFFMFSTGFTSFSVLLLFPLSITFFDFMHGF